MPDQEIKTSIDGLVAYLNQHGETNTTTVASALGVGETTIIEWSNILEKANVIKIVHKSGRMFLSPLTGGTVINDTKATQGADEMNIQAEVGSQMAIVNQISAKIEQFNRSLATVDDLFKVKYKAVKPFLDRVNEIQNRVDSYEKRMSTKSKQIEDIEDKMQKEFDSLQKYSASLSSFNMDTNNARGVSDDIKGRLAAYNGNMEEMSKGLDQLIYKYRKNALEMHREMKERSEQLKQIVGLEDRQIAEYERTAKDYKRDSEAIIRGAEQRRKAAIDDIEKTKQEVRRLNGIAERDIRSLQASLDELKKGLGGISGLNDDMVAIRKSLGDVTTQKNALIKELNTMMQDLKNVEGMKKSAEKQTKTATLKKEVDKATEKIISLNQSTEKVGHDFNNLGEGRTEEEGPSTNNADTGKKNSGNNK